MSVRELVEMLSAMPPNAKVYWLEEGGEDEPVARTPVYNVRISLNGTVVYLED